MRLVCFLTVSIVLKVFTTTYADQPVNSTLAAQLAASSCKLVYESYTNNNWDLFVSRADTSERVNLTATMDQHELYPQVSPDGSRVCFVVDQGQGRQTIRSVWVMNIDGTDRTKVADHARQPCWNPDNKTILYLPQEYKKFNIADYFTKGIVYYNVDSKTSRPHPHSDKIHHLYNPCFAAHGKWIVATVHAGMGYKHAILLIEAEGSRIIDLQINGCRPCLSADGQRIAWGQDDHTIVVAELDVTTETPKIGKRIFHVRDKQNKIYHSDLSPDGEYLSLSRGPDGKGDLSKIGTHEAACEMVGVYASNWNILVVPLSLTKSLDLNDAQPNDYFAITSDGNSNKEPDWFLSR